MGGDLRVPALSAHILLEPERDCHERRQVITDLVQTSYDIDHITLQVDHVAPMPFVPTADVVHPPVEESR